MIVTAACVGIFGVLCGIVGYGLGRRAGILSEFRDAQREMEVIEFVVEDIRKE